MWTYINKICYSKYKPDKTWVFEFDPKCIRYRGENSRGNLCHLQKIGNFPQINYDSRIIQNLFWNAIWKRIKLNQTVKFNRVHTSASGGKKLWERSRVKLLFLRCLKLLSKKKYDPDFYCFTEVILKISIDETKILFKNKINNASNTSNIIYKSNFLERKSSVLICQLTNFSGG